MLFTQAMIKFVGSFIQIWNAAKDETAVSEGSWIKNKNSWRNLCKYDKCCKRRL